MNARRTRSGGRAARRAARSKTRVESVPYIERKIPVYSVAPDETLELIERNADLLLAEIGIDFRDDPEALDLWRQAGATVSGERVRFEPGMLRQIPNTPNTPHRKLTR